MTPPRLVREALKLLEKRVNNPTQALEAVARVRSWLIQLEASYVEAARMEGVSWFGIAKALGRSKQAVWEMYHDPTRPDDQING